MIVLDLVTNIEQPPVDIDRLVLFYYNSTVINPDVVAAKDKDMFIVEEIKEHRKLRNNKYDILVKWLGYDNPEDVSKIYYYKTNLNIFYYTYTNYNENFGGLCFTRI